MRINWKWLVCKVRGHVCNFTLHKIDESGNNCRVLIPMYDQCIRCKEYIPRGSYPFEWVSLAKGQAVMWNNKENKKADGDEAC